MNWNYATLQLLTHPYFIKWCPQNWIGEPHPKIQPIPIGLDYHTMHHSSGGWGPQINPAGQEAMLIKIKTMTRKIKCFGNFHFQMNTQFGYERKLALEQLPKEVIDYQPSYSTREETWKLQSTYAFVISPYGNGLDCHRTWEALLLGCFVIVKKGPLDPLYAGLPVVIVSNWSDVTHELLNSTYEE
jgi:hypothetical protein